MIASLCEVEPESMRPTFKRFSLKPLSCFSGTDSSLAKSDVVFYQLIRQRFVVELVRLMKYRTSTITLDDIETGFMFKTLIEGAMDTNALNIFPTSNYKIMVDIGGTKSKEREERRAHKLINSLEKTAENYTDTDTNIEIRCLQRVKDNLLGSPGLYVATYLWSFVRDLGIILNERSMNGVDRDEVDPLHNIGKALLENDNDMESSVQEICKDILGSLSLISLERQCMKRFMLLRSLFNAIIQYTTSKKSKEFLMNELLATLIKQMLQELDIIATGIEYNAKNQERKQSYESAKAHALQNAYSHLSITTASWLIKQISLSRPGLHNNHTRLLFRCLLLSSLRIAGGQNFTHDRLIRFDFTPKYFCSSSNNFHESLSTDLFNATNCHIRELVIYAASSNSKSDESTLFYEIMDTTFCRTESNNFVINLLPALVNGIEHQSRYTNSLSVALQLYVSLVSMNCANSKQKEENAIRKFRSFAVSFSVRKLWHKDIKKKVVMLDYLAQILDTESLRRSCGNNFDFSISYGKNLDERYLDFGDDICRILYGLSSCLEAAVKSMVFDDSMMHRTFSCLRHLVMLKVEEVDFLKWCETRKNSNSHAKYVVIEVKFLFHLSSLIIGPVEPLIQLSSYLRNNDRTVGSPEMLNENVRQCRLMIEARKALAKELFSNLSRIVQNDPTTTRYNATSEAENYKSINQETVDRIKDFIHFSSLNTDLSV